MQTYDFRMNAHGRCGAIRCSDGENIVDIDWEMSGSPEYDILLAPLDLRRWASGAEIPRDAQHRMMSQLREWLNGQGIRSDATPPRQLKQRGEVCQRSGCSQKAPSGSAYCAFHFDESLLR
jgi:hypothetical protein